MLVAWRAGRAFSGMKTCWKCFKMTDLQCALNLLHYWLCQRRFHRQLPSCESISSCWLPREHTQLLMYKMLFCYFCPVTLLPPALSSGSMGSSSQALTTSKKSHMVKQVSLHTWHHSCTPTRTKSKIASSCTRMDLSITPSANTLVPSCATSHSHQPFLLSL